MTDRAKAVAAGIRAAQKELEDAGLAYRIAAAARPQTSDQARAFHQAMNRLDRASRVHKQAMDAFHKIPAPEFRINPGGRQPKRKKPVSKRSASIFDQAVNARMQEIAEVWSSMPRTGRARFADDEGRPVNYGFSEVVGVNKGYARAYPEVAGLAAPGRIIDAIRKRRGRLFEDVKLAVEDWAAKRIPLEAPLSRGRKAGPHPSIRVCRICRTAHTGTSHRSHGAGAFRRRAAPVASLGDLRPAMTKQRRAELLDNLAFEQRRQARRLGPSVQAEEMPDWVLDNPPVEIYPATRGVLLVGMKKGPGHPCDAECKRAGHRYRHRFPEAVRVIGRGDGSVLLQRRS